MNYPNKKIISKVLCSKSNRGMSLEYAINESNKYYLANNIAVIYKKPVPIQVVDVLYPSRNKTVITKAYYKTPSTTDYNGIYKGNYIDFEAKETSSSTSFPLSNIHLHQITHLKKIAEHGGIGFLIFFFKSYNEYYLIPLKIINEFWNNNQNTRKSIPYVYIKEKAFPIKEGYNPRLDYIKVIREKLI